MNNMINYHFAGEEQVESPALIYYLDQIEENTDKVITMAGGARRLWPHVKTHKMAAMVRMQINRGISRFKCATISEAQMCAEEGAAYALVSYPLIGPMIAHFINLRNCYAKTRFIAIGDDLKQLEILGKNALRARTETGLKTSSDDSRANPGEFLIDVLIDVNLGMNRTGVPLDDLENFYMVSEKIEGLRIIGLHCYDGHLGISDLEERKKETKKFTDELLRIKTLMEKRGIKEPVLIMGGTPTFPVHINTPGVFLSPGTLFVNDNGYALKFQDLSFPAGAAILTRVISHPGPGLFTLDTGYKAIGSEKPERGVIVGLSDAKPVAQSEEHWVWTTKNDARPPIGTILYIIPNHICPTTALYPGVSVVSKGKLVDYWEVTARNRLLAFH
ncbi:MAG: D-TA family PLP-dependent enzyme [Treponema sp.]|nr:D-TA family PLP-dependent enzyme [Treponema sp.]